MNRRLWRIGVAGLAVVLMGAAALHAATTSSPVQRATYVPGKAEGDVPAALARHLEALKESIPGNGGEPAQTESNGPTTSGLQDFAELAYPAKDVSLAKIQAARQAFASARLRSVEHNRRSRWEQVGPDTALYQLTELRKARDYVPNQYAAGGRTTDLAIDPHCGQHRNRCRMWITPAGGGVWRTNNALSHNPNWEYLSGSFGINSVGSIAIDPNDPTSNTLWVGTGEGNTCGSGCVAGVGLYKSTDGGNQWTGPIGQSAFNARGVGTIAVKPGNSNVIYAGSSFGVRGHASSCCYGAVSQYRALIPGAPQWGLYKSTNGGATWTLVHNGAATPAECGASILAIAQNATPCSPRGVRRVQIDPSNPNIVYAASYARGVWRSNDGGTTWTQIKDSMNAAVATTRPDIAITRLGNGNTRMYVGEGNVGTPFSALFRSDDVATGAPVFTQLTSDDPAVPAWHSFNFCTGQCWYDNWVYTPPGQPDMLYAGGSYQYDEDGIHGPYVANHRAVLLSTDAGANFTDMTYDGTDTDHPNGIHPDEHRLVTNPQDPNQFFEASDGGLIRSDGRFVNRSSDCNSRGLAEPYLSRCHELLSRIPRRLESMNRDLPTLQFQSLSVSPFNSRELQGGTQDNGTWENFGSRHTWLQTMWGDGGQSGFDAANRHFRFHTFFDASPDVNFMDGRTSDWNWIGDPIFGTGGLFYVPIISDPVVSRTMFVGTTTALRTKTHGMGTMSLAEFRQHCNEFTGDFAVPCGDWEELGASPLTDPAWGDREGGAVTATERTPADTSTLWAATSTGRVFISRNADADPASAVTFTRLDSLSTADPDRFVTGLYVDPSRPNRAWITYGGFNATTPTTPGHIFRVNYNPGAGTATWTSLDGNLGDLPLTDVVRDASSRDIFVSSDFGVLKRSAGSSNWTTAASGMPNVEVPGLTLVESDEDGHGGHNDNAKLYAASHGLGAWLLRLDDNDR
jgi:hypothetical protein